MIDIKQIPCAVKELNTLAENNALCSSDEVMRSAFYIAVQGQEEVSLANSDLSQNGILLATRILAQSPSLKALEIQGNILGANGVAVAAILAESSSLIMIDMSSNNLRRNAIGVSQHLSELKTLRELDLGLNDIRDYGMGVAEEIIKSSSLETLHIYANNLKAEVAVCLAKSPSLYSLLMYDVNLGSHYLGVITSVIASPNIHEFRISGLNAFDRSTAQSIARKHNNQWEIEMQGVYDNLNQIFTDKLLGTTYEYIGHDIEIIC